MSEKSKKAQELFLDGYNCCQSVFCVFCDELNIPYESALKLTSSFGGGMGKLREVCGAVSAMFMIAGLKYGYTSPEDFDAKTNHYKLIQDLATEFKIEFGSIICRDLIDTDSDGHIPSKRTKEYYETRPCYKIIGKAAEIIEKY